MKDIFKKLLSSFDNTTTGFSARKLSAFAAVVVGVVATFKFGSDTNIVEILTVWLGFALLCLGIITVQQIIDFKNGPKPTNP